MAPPTRKQSSSRTPLEPVKISGLERIACNSVKDALIDKVDTAKHENGGKVPYDFIDKLTKKEQASASNGSMDWLLPSVLRGHGLRKRQKLSPVENDENDASTATNTNTTNTTSTNTRNTTNTTQPTCNKGVRPPNTGEADTRAFNEKGTHATNIATKKYHDSRVAMKVAANWTAWHSHEDHRICHGRSWPAR